MKPKPTTDREMILSEDHWSRWPLLPLKRVRDGRLETAVLVAPVDKHGKCYISRGNNVFEFDEDLSTNHGEPIMVDDVLAEGWKVD
jgi:hypothetical protein